MAYAALISLKQTMERLLKSRHISIVQNISSKIITFQYAQVVSLEQLIEKLNENIDVKTKLDNIISLEELNEIDGLLREGLHEVEDVIETCVSKAYLAQYGQDHEVRSSSSLLLLDLQEWRQDLHSLTIKLKEMQEDIKEVNNLYEYDGLGDSSDEPNDLSPDTDYKLFEDDEDDENDEGSCKHKSKVVGLSNLLSQVREQLMSSFVLHDGMVHLWGMAGIGKTTLAKEIMKDPLIKKHFKRRILIRVGPNRKFGEFVRELNDLFHDVFHSKVCKRYLLVLDDVWSLEALEILKGLLPNLRNGKRILVTTRIGSVAEPEVNRYTNLIPFLSGEDSWILLRDRVFGENDCPRELEKPGRKIAEVCAGLPLTIVTVANILSQSEEKNAEYWNQVAAKQTSVFFDAYEEMSEVLLPSYDYLPQHIKPCFLYFGILPEDDVISHSKLINLWTSEGFIPKNLIGSLFEFVTKSLVALVSRNVLILHRNIHILVSWSGLDTNRYQLHPAFLHLCVREAKKAKFHHVLSHYIEDAAEVLQGQRRLCIHNNVLFAIRDLYDSMSSVSTVRSLLCTGLYHQYPVPICSGLMLLRVLDALTVRFYEFPAEVLKLFQLRYFAMTLDAELSASISTLWNLEYLIVNRHVSIIESSGNPSYLPMEIWDMKRLKHLQIMGSDLPDPNEEESLLPNLLTLLDVGARSCTKRVLERIPNLRRLGIRIELAPDNVESALGCFDHMSYLSKLLILRCVIVNPIFSIARPTLLPIFPNLDRLSLSGCGFQWEEIRVIGSLRSLMSLKLQCYAFRGPKWETREGEFPSLKYLSIEDTDLTVWIIGDTSFESLERIIIKHCYQLEEIEGDLGRVGEIEVVDCGSLAVKQIISQVAHARNHSSWDDRKHKA